MADLEPAKPLNLDVLVYVLSKTLISPGFAAMAVAFTYMFQVNSASCVLIGNMASRRQRE